MTSALHDPLTPPLLNEVAPTVLQRTDVSGVPCGAVASDPDQVIDVFHPVGVRDFDVGIRIRPEGGDYPASEHIVGGEGGVIPQVVQRIIGGGQDHDDEVGEELAPAECRLPEYGLQRMERTVGCSL